MTSVDVLIAGAGPAGSALAAALARGGASVLLVESAVHPRPKTCAEYASPRIVEELARLDVADAWMGAAVPLRGMNLYAGGRSTQIRYADGKGPRDAWGVDRRSFDARLAEHAVRTGAVLRERARLVSLICEGRTVRGATLRDQATGRDEIVSAAWTVGADGTRSNVSRLVGVDRPVRFPRRLGLVAHYSGVAGLTDHGEMHVGRGYYLGLAPTPGGELNVGMALSMGTPGQTANARFDAAIAGLPAVARRLAHSERLTSIRGAAPIGHRVSSAAGPGWLLVGDAAGFVDPFTGEGIHRALRSARAAADAILAGGDVAAAYRAQRRRAFAAKTALSWLVQGFLAAPPLLDRAVARLSSRPRAALRLGSALGDCRPATDALSPAALLEVFAP
ncbi:MAG: geranylgeranyl reductase family protein [Chloroflexi bacterium]|nr:geranylgeranyl reductase family protein [Chloroflexota bacterium]